MDRWEQAEDSKLAKLEESAGAALEEIARVRRDRKERDKIKEEERQRAEMDRLAAEEQARREKEAQDRIPKHITDTLDQKRRRQFYLRDKMHKHGGEFIAADRDLRKSKSKRNSNNNSQKGKTAAQRLAAAITKGESVASHVLEKGEQLKALVRHLAEEQADNAKQLAEDTAVVWTNSGKRQTERAQKKAQERFFEAQELKAELQKLIYEKR